MFRFNRFVLTFVLCSFSLFLFCEEDKTRIMTVNGAIAPKELGLTLPHEHVLVDFIGADSTGYFRWNRHEVIEKVLPYLMEIKALGFKTMVECTPAYLGRDPRLLKALSEKSGIQILTNTGYYGARANKHLPAHAFTESVDQLAGRWIAEWRNGIEDSGIRPGFMKIGIDRDDTLSVMHAKLIRAAARTHLQTGLPIMSHTGPESPAFAALAILKEEGVLPDAFIWTHAQRGTPDSHIEAARQGAWISLDNMKADSARIQKFVQFLNNLKQHELLHRVLISHDAGWYRVGEPGGGEFRPYTAISRQLIPELKMNGFSETDIRQLIVDNPREAFRIGVKKFR